MGFVQGDKKCETFSILLGRAKSLHHIGLCEGDILQFCRLSTRSGKFLGLNNEMILKERTLKMVNLVLTC